MGIPSANNSCIISSFDDNFNKEFLREVDEQEFFSTYFKVNSSGASISFGGSVSEWSIITNVCYQQANHRIQLGIFTFIDEGGFTHKPSVWLQASRSAVNSITLDSSVVF